GEDLFLDGLVEPYRTRAIELIRQQVRDVDTFIAVSDYYVPTMASMLAIPRDRIAVVPLGINLAGYDRGTRRVGDGGVRVGYFARIAPERGLQVRADAYARLRERTAGAPMRLEAAGYLAPAQQGYLDDVKRTLERGGVAHEFRYHGAVDRAGKLAFLQ